MCSNLLCIQFLAYNSNTIIRWKTREQPLRIGIIIAGNAVGSLVGTGINFGALELAGDYAASRWKWIYVVLGSCALFVGVVALFLLPATPMKAWFLSPRERRIAVCRLMSNKTGIHTRKVKWRQGLSAFLDPQVYLLCIFSFAFAFSNVAISRYVTVPCGVWHDSTDQYYRPSP
jgi:MFS family permease